MHENKLILTHCRYGYELKTHDNRFFAIKWNGKKWYAERFAASPEFYQMTGTFIKNIPDAIKRLVLDLNKKPE